MCKVRYLGHGAALTNIHRWQNCLIGLGFYLIVNYGQHRFNFYTSYVISAKTLHEPCTNQWGSKKGSIHIVKTIFYGKCRIFFINNFMSCCGLLLDLPSLCVISHSLLRFFSVFFSKQAMQR